MKSVELAAAHPLKHDAKKRKPAFRYNPATHRALAAVAALLCAGAADASAAQVTASPAPPPTVPESRTATIKSLRVEGSLRIEPETVLSYTKLRVGQVYTNETLDQAIKDLYASDLFADVSISGAESGDIVLRIRENPVINRVVFEGNKRLKEDKIQKEIKLAPRQIFTRTAVRQDVGRIIELYRRQGRFAATIDPKMVALDQNRVDVIFEINEGPKSKVRQINILGNKVFSDAKLRAQMATKETRLKTILSSNTSYDQDRMAYDQQKLRQFYLTEGYADFRVTSAVAELTPDKKDFIITYVVEEGPRYKFGDVTVDSDIRDFDNKTVAASLGIKKGEWYDAKRVENAVDATTQAAGLHGYAFADVNPEFNRDKDTLTMSLNFHIAEAKRTYVERIDINGNTNTKDKVIRREIRLAEGDAFNSFQVKRSQDRINSLGYFQDKFEIKQVAGSSPDRVVLESNVQEKSTGEISLSAGYSDLEGFIVNAGLTQHNFRGMGQELRLSGSLSEFSKSVDLGFTEPYLFDKNIALGGDIFRRDFNSFNTIGDTSSTTYDEVTTGFQIRAGVPLSEYWSAQLRYQLSQDQVSLDPATFFTNGVCDPALAGQYLCDALGNRTTSSIGYSLVYDTRNNRLRPTSGEIVTLSQDYAGLGGSVRYLRSTLNASKYWGLGSGFTLTAHAEGGYIWGIGQSVRLTDRFFLGEPEMSGFDIRGVGPRVTRFPYDTSTTPATLTTSGDSVGPGPDRRRHLLSWQARTRNSDGRRREGIGHPAIDLRGCRRSLRRADPNRHRCLRRGQQRQDRVCRAGSPANRRERPPPVSQPRRDHHDQQYGRARQFFARCVSRGLFRQHATSPRVGRSRRQLEFAVRAVADRCRQGAGQGSG